LVVNSEESLKMTSEGYREQSLAKAKAIAEQEGEAKPKPDIEMSFIKLADGTLAEEIRNPLTGKVAFAVYRNGVITYEDSLTVEGKTYKPVDNDIVKQGGVLLSSEAVNYGTLAELLEDIRLFIHKWVDVSPQFEKLACYYALLTWVYDAFTVLPYLRFLSQWSTGKTRAKITIGVLCYKPLSTSGASTNSPIFRMLELFAGTMLIDEADITKSDESAEFIKILNTGYEKGSPLWRSERGKGDKFEVRAYPTYCPKILASRKKFQDAALESRFLTEEMNRSFDKARIPLNLLPEFWDEALAIRNKCLFFRLTKLLGIKPVAAYAQDGIEPRVSQMLSSLLQVMESDEDKAELIERARAYTQIIQEDRGGSQLGELVAVLFDFIDEHKELTIKAICQEVNDRAGGGKGEEWSPRRTAALAKTLGLKVKRMGKGSIIDIKASERAMELLRRQYKIDKTIEDEVKPVGKVKEHLKRLGSA
jgi:hypothetical protein